jgi:hypothetical protein
LARRFESSGLRIQPNVCRGGRSLTARKTCRVQKSQGRRRPQVGGDSPSHVDRRNAVPLVGEGGGSVNSHSDPTGLRSGGGEVPAGTAASARSTEAMRCPIKASALSTLIRQRPPTPSCGGLSPYRGENSGPGRTIAESLTPIPELENSLG